MRSYMEKTEYIKETRQLTQRSRVMRKPECVEIAEKSFIVYPGVFHPGIFFSTRWFASEVTRLTKDSVSFCEVGCGTGVISILVALAHPTLRVMSVDVSKQAVENTRENINRFSLDQRCVVEQSDVLTALKKNDQFDLLFWAAPFGYLHPGRVIDLVDQQTFDPGYRSIELFLKQAKRHVTVNGRVFLGFSEELADRSLLETLCKMHGYTIRLVAQEVGIEVQKVTMQILELIPV